MWISSIQVLTACSDLEPKLVQGRTETHFQGMATDSSQVRPGQLFVALDNERTDTQDHIFQALARGAKGLLVRTGWQETIHSAVRKMDPETVIIEAVDTRAALKRMAYSQQLYHLARNRTDCAALDRTASDIRVEDRPHKPRTFSWRSSRERYQAADQTARQLIGPVIAGQLLHGQAQPWSQMAAE